MRLRHTLILVCLLIPSILRAEQANIEIDSLTAQLEKLGHTLPRLETLYELTLVSSGNPEQQSMYNDMLLEEAQKQQNDQYKCNAYYNRIMIAYNSYDNTEVVEAQKHLEPLARKLKHYDQLFRGWRCKVDMMILTQNYEQCEKEAKQMLAQAEKLDSKSGILEAHQCLANIYRSTFRKEQAVELLEQSRKMAVELKHENSVINISQMLLFLCEEIGNYEVWLRNLTQYEAYLKQPIENNQPLLLLVYAGYVNYYSQRSTWIMAEKYRLKGEEYYAEVTAPLYRIIFDNSCSAYYNRAGKYELALERQQMAIDQMSQLAHGVDYHNQIYTKAVLLQKLNRSEEALPLFERVFIFSDSLQLATIEKQHQQLRKDFNADRLLVEQAKIQHRMQLYTMLLLGIGLILVLYYSFYLLRSRCVLRKNECEMREMNNQMEQVNEAKDRFLSNISTSIRTPLNIVVDGALSLSTQDVTDHNERRLLSNQINTLSASLLTMINDILDLSRLEAGMMKFDIVDVELTTLIQSTLSISPDIDNIEVNLDLPADTLYLVKADSGRLQQVLNSLFARQCAQFATLQITAHHKEPLFCINIRGCKQAQEAPPQEIIIRNEINRMLINQFGGEYQINQASNELSITLPLAEVVRPE